MITQDQLKEVLSYNPETGVFSWVVSRGKAKSGKEAGTIDLQGYVQIGIGGKLFRAHRLAWLYMTGSFPKEQIDHINMVRSDNRWENLREANQTQNHANRLINKNNTSGFRGVFFHRAANKWWSMITENNQGIYLGLFPTREEAAVAYRQAAVKLFGEYARLP